MFTPNPHTIIELNKTAFDHNISLYRKIVGPQTAISVVLKSNAYGHGLKEIAQFCQHNPDVAWVCTAMLSEALQLRNMGFTKPILVLSIIDQDPALALENSIDLPVFDIQTAQQLNTCAKIVNKKISVHVKIDSGMARFGFAPEDAVKSVKEIHEMPHLSVHGIFTHCVESGNPDQSYTTYQLEQFNAIITQLENLGIVIPYKHAANSAAASTVHTRFKHLNFIRLGAGAFGLWHFRNGQDEHLDLTIKPVLSWKTYITHIKTVPPDTWVGYDRTYKTPQPTQLATIPVGYYDGYDRRFTNLGTVRVNDFFAPVVGRICMNATIIAIPADKSVAIGDPVILLGNYPQISAHDLAKTINSFNAREITTRISSHIERSIVEHAVGATVIPSKSLVDNATK